MATFTNIATETFFTFVKWMGRAYGLDILAFA